MTATGKNWFVLLKGKRYGPYTFASLALAVESGVVDPGAGVWCVGWEEWRIARDVPGLFNQEAALEDQEEGVVSSEEEEDDCHDEYRDELDDSSEDVQQEVAPHASAASEPAAARNARIVILSVLSVLVIVAAAVWSAVSLGFLRVTLLF